MRGIFGRYCLILASAALSSAVSTAGTGETGRLRRCRADGRRRRSEDREPRREAGRLTGRLRDLPFAEQYAAWQRARWHLGLGESPVDVLSTRGDTLLAAWFAGTGQVCYESLLKRAARDDLVALRACGAVQG